MKIFERIYYSIIGKKVKTVLLLLVITLLGTFLSASFSIYQANQPLEKGVRENLTPVVLIEWKNFEYDEWEDDEIIKNEKKISEIIEKYRQDERIGAYENRYLLYNLDFHHQQLLDSENKPFLTGIRASQQIFKDGEQIEEFDYSGINLIGIDNYQISDIQNQSFDLTHGRVFNEEEILNGENKCFYMVDKHRYPENYIRSNPMANLYIDKAYLTNYKEKANTTLLNLNYTYSFEMVGVGHQVENVSPSKYHSHKTNLIGSVYVPIKTLNKIGKDYQEISNQIMEEYPWAYDGYQSAKYIGKTYVVETYIELKDADELSGLLLDLKRDCGNLVRNIYSYSDSYNDVQGITRSLNLIAIISLVVCSVASIILLSLIIQVFVNERKYEIGVYLSLGESKKNVITQILCEILLVGLLGISTSLFTGNMIGKSLSSDLLERQIKQHEEIHNGMSDQNNYEISQEEILDTYEVSITMEYIICVYAGGLVVLLLSSVYPMNSILKMKAKKMLQ